MMSSNTIIKFLKKYTILIILVIIILVYNIYSILNTKSIEKFDTNSCEIILARYNEDVKWINEEPYNNFKVICYNKGDNNIKINNLKKVIQLPNVGRESHSYLYHIINNYDNLANISVFLMGSMTDTIHKKNQKLKLLFENLNFDNSIFICQTYNNVKDELYDFTLQEYKSTNKNNSLKNNDKTLDKAEIYPFGKWFEHYFNDIIITHISYNSIFAINKKHILQHPKEYYIKLIKQLEKSSNPEVGHYFERSWEAVFYPLDQDNNTKFIEIKTV